MPKHIVSTTLVAVVACLSGAVSASAQTLPRPQPTIGLAPYYVVFIGANVADLWTTKVALDRGGSEASPLMQGAGFKTIVAEKLLWTVAAAAAIRLLELRGHPRWARGLALVGGGAAGLAAAHNSALPQSR